MAAYGNLPLILNVERLGMVGSPSAFNAHRCLQQVVAVFQAGGQAVVEGQREDTLEVGHHASLVALQLFVAGEVGVVGRELALRVVAIGQRDGGIMIIVGVAVPVDVE